MLALAALLAAPTQACCAVVAGPADAEPERRATTVVALRSGKTTVLTLVTDVAGAAERLALVVPVEAGVTEVDVRPTQIEAVERVDALSAPRLVEMWHHDPCGEGKVPPAHRRVGRLPPLPPPPALPAPPPAPAPRGRRGRPAPKPSPPPEAAPWAEIAVLPWESSTGPTVEGWLRSHGLVIPAAARAEVARLGAAGTRFAVARPSPSALVHSDGRTRLPPLRIRTRGDQLTLPLALTASNGEPHDTVVLVLASDRYAPVDTDHTFAPTGLVLSDTVIGTFAETWDGLFRTLAAPNTVVTEYSWQASRCDPCPIAPLDRATVGALGGHLLRSSDPSQLVLTRLHLRVDPATSGDLTLGVAGLVSGGNGPPDALQEGASVGDAIDFQTRFVVKHRFTGGVICEEPDWRRWGGPPGGEPRPVQLATSQVLEPVTPEPAGDLAEQLEARIAGIAPPPRSAGVLPPARMPGTEVPTGCRTGPSGGIAGLPLLVAMTIWRRRREVL